MSDLLCMCPCGGGFCDETDVLRAAARIMNSRIKNRRGGRPRKSAQPASAPTPARPVIPVSQVPASASVRVPASGMPARLAVLDSRVLVPFND